jgi:hypothetical protein
MWEDIKLALSLYCSTACFSLIGHLPIQNVSADAQGHFEAAQTHLESYYAHFGSVMDS